MENFHSGIWHLKLRTKKKWGGVDPPILTKSNNSLIPVCFLSRLRSTRNAATETHSLHFQTCRPTAPVSGRPLTIIGKGRTPRPRKPQESACLWLKCAFRRGSPLRYASRMLQLWRQLMSWNRAREDAYVYAVRCAPQIALRSYRLRLGTATQPTTSNTQPATPTQPHRAAKSENSPSKRRVIFSIASAASGSTLKPIK